MGPRKVMTSRQRWVVEFLRVKTNWDFIDWSSRLRLLCNRHIEVGSSLFHRPLEYKCTESTDTKLIYIQFIVIHIQHICALPVKDRVFLFLKEPRIQHLFKLPFFLKLSTICILRVGPGALGRWIVKLLLEGFTAKGDKT